MPAVALLAILLQTATSPSGDGVVPPPSTATRATAVRAKTPVVIDGRDDDEVGRVAPAITQFREFQPKEDGDPRFATEAKVAYDDRYLYVFIRAFDPHPDSILKLLARRDVRAATDQLKIMIDSYHDRRNGYEFAVNPAGVPSPRRPEIAPYVVTKNVSEPTGGAFDRSQKVTGGADLKYGITSNLTLDATVNPDFGQVEADPAVLNLTAFETFFQERRPFFVAGTGVFRFDVNCSQVNCNSEGLFYSRRVGRAPHLTDLYGDASSPTGTTIIGAGKVTGRLAGGLNLRVLEGVTARETGPQDRTIEPLTNYAVVRAFQDLRHGESGVGVMATAVDRNLDVWTDPYLRQSAYVGAMDFRHRFPGGRYQLSGSLDLSRVAGTGQAIAATQQSPVHFYQRPDGSQTFDSTRTTLMGDAEELLFGKVGGGITRFQTSYQRRSPGFEVNDLGFLLRADQQSWNNWFGLQSLHPTSIYQQAFWNFNWWQYWAADGLALERAANSNAQVQLKNRRWLHAGATLGQLGTTFCDRCARGGPAVRADPYFAPWFEWDGDSRPPVVPAVWGSYWRGGGGRSEAGELNTQGRVRLAPQVNVF